MKKTIALLSLLFTAVSVTTEIRSIDMSIFGMD